MVQVDGRLEKYDIYEPIGIDSIANYFINRLNGISRLRIEGVNNTHHAIYTVEITDEEAMVIMLSIPDIVIKKFVTKINT